MIEEAHGEEGNDNKLGRSTGVAYCTDTETKERDGADDAGLERRLNEIIVRVLRAFSENIDLARELREQSGERAQTMPEERHLRGGINPEG